MSKKKKRRKLKLKRIIICLLILIIIVMAIFNRDDISTYIDSLKLGYDTKTISLFKEENVYEKIKDKKYSKTVETAIKSSDFDSKYLDDYYNITYVDSPNFIKYINKLLVIGYQDKEINAIYTNLEESNIDTILEYEYNKDLINYLSLDYFKKDYLKRYLDFNNNDHKLDFSPYISKLNDDDLDYNDIVTYVNANLDNEYYTNYNEIKNGNDPLVLVNKYNKLSSDFVPDDLQTISSECSYGTQKLVGTAKKAFEEMCNYMHTINLYPRATSTYRSYSYQTTLYNNYVNRDGKQSADTYSARAGFSEHQTGLAIDVGSTNSSIFEKSDEYKWMIDNAHKYGFILRYPKGKEYITGYVFESWHYRYVGVDLATYIYKNDITYDEYIARK